jgi:hypothetical protein
MAKYYDAIPVRTKGAWVVHHGQKTAATISGAAEFPALDAAGKAASLMRLGRYFGNGGQFWLDLQSQYDLAMVEREYGSEIRKRVRPVAA